MIGTPRGREEHRGCVRSGGTARVAFDRGAYTVADRDGSLLAHQAAQPELAGALASVCQGHATICLFSDPARVHVFRLSGGELVPERAFRMPGLPMRFVLVEDVLWVMGAATVRAPAQ